ncbi:unnamed protein product [Tuber aestivum]|uniref:C2H2-type domain-containing protein n=1 Tax=Tuber aestivum TaxID=59557 RepID=A0A292PTZ9_9PEZI|nr:unnamed protein product [Tuber aestivum]
MQQPLDTFVPCFLHPGYGIFDCPCYSPTSSPNVADNTSLIWHSEETPSSDSGSPQTIFGSDESISGFCTDDEASSLSSDERAMNLRPVDVTHGHRQPNATQHSNQEAADDTSIGGGTVTPVYTPHYNPSTISPNGTSELMRHHAPERSGPSSPIIMVSARVKKAMGSCEKQAPRGPGGAGRGVTKHPCLLGCGKEFSRTTDEKRHRETSSAHSRGEVQKYYQCDLCKTKFNRRDNLNQHKKRGTKGCKQAVEEIEQALEELEQAVKERERAKEWEQVSRLSQWILACAVS